MRFVLNSGLLHENEGKKVNVNSEHSDRQRHYFTAPYTHSMDYTHKYSTWEKRTSPVHQSVQKRNKTGMCKRNRNRRTVMLGLWELC